MADINADLPAPTGPTTATSSPGLTDNSILDSTRSLYLSNIKAYFDKRKLSASPSHVNTPLVIDTASKPSNKSIKRSV